MDIPLVFITFFSLIQRDLRVFLPDLRRNVINASIFIFLTSFTYQYIMPLEGIQGQYGIITACGGIVAWGMFAARSKVGFLVRDITGFRTLDFFLTLPLPQWAVFVALAFATALRPILVVIGTFPVIKLLFWDTLLLSHIAWLKFITILVLINIFYGFAVLWFTACCDTVGSIQNLWMRMVFPLWWVGGYGFIWKTFYSVSPAGACIGLLNPLVYGYEGLRGAVLGQAGYINFWYCAGALILASIMVGYIGTRRMMARLDCL